MATLRELKGRIGSVASSEKITGAMKMISSAKMHKSEMALRKLLPFRSQIETIIGNLLTADVEFDSPLIQSRQVNKIGIVIFGSNDGLCGAYNVNIVKVLHQQIQSYRIEFGSNVDIVIYPVGSKVVKAVSKIADAHIKVEVPEGVDANTSGEGVKDFMQLLQDAFVGGDIDRVDVLYMSFKSVSRQRACCQQLLPVVSSTFTANGDNAACRPYIFEPDANVIFQAVLPMFLLSVMQDVFTENRASEQAARVMAMQSANDNAKKLLEQLRIEYNKLRQNSITTELLDILGGQIR